MFLKCDPLDAASLAKFVMLGVRVLVRVGWEIHCEDGRFLRPGSFEEGCRSRGPSCSGRAAIDGSRGSLEKPLATVDDFGRVGWEWIVGRLATGRGLERVFAVVEMAGATLRLAVVGGGMFEMLLVPKTEPVARRSLEADVRSRGVLASPGPVGAAARLSLDGARRRGMPVGLGAGRRDIGLGRPLVLPAGSLLSSMGRGVGVVEVKC